MDNHHILLRPMPDPSATEDMVQEALVRWYERGGIETVPGGMLAWCSQALRYVIWNRVRRRNPDPLDANPLSLSEDWARVDDDD